MFTFGSSRKNKLFLFISFLTQFLGKASFDSLTCDLEAREQLRGKCLNPWAQTKST